MGDINSVYDHSPAQAAGRISAAWMHIGPLFGIVFVSIYLFTKEGMTPRNRVLLSSAMALAKAIGSLWVGGEI